jgi:secondary thiamine-phosphate synthase enzyme
VQFQDITPSVEKCVADSGVENGMCFLYVPHTTAAVLINENYDPEVAKDLADLLEQLAPPGRDYHHEEGNADAHLKAAIVGVSKELMVEHGRLALGRWQGIFFCEFDGPRHRDLRVKIIPD